jgi:hypothetical protein
MSCSFVERPWMLPIRVEVELIEISGRNIAAAKNAHHDPTMSLMSSITNSTP